MNNTGALIFINNREALPVRAIPYYSAWRLTPDLLANEFSLGDIDLCNWLRNIPTYHMVNDEPVKILSSEWNDSDLALKSLAIKLKSEFKNKDQGYEAWRTNSVTKLPAGAFVWLDDFLNSCSENNIEPPDLTASAITQENLFTSHPIILKDSSIRGLVYEGFESYFSVTCNNVDDGLASEAGAMEVSNEHGKADAQPKHTKTINKLNNERTHILDKVLKSAADKAENPNDVNQVWVELTALASLDDATRPKPLLDLTEDDGVKYLNSGKVIFFTKKNLRDRMYRIRRKLASTR